MARLGDRRTLEDGRIQELQRVGHGQKWVTVDNFRPGEQEVVGQDSGATHTVRVGMSMQTRPGYGREQDPIGYAFYSVYGRGPTLAERNSWGQQNQNGNWESASGVMTIMRQLSVTPEAQRLGINPSDYGVEDVDPDTLTGGDREFYDSWRRANPGAPFRNTELDYLRWAQGAGNIQAFEAVNRGLIYDVAATNQDGSPLTYDDGSPITITVVTPEATRQAGEDEIWLSGTKAGKLYYGDLANVKLANVDQLGDAEEGTGFYSGIATGSPKEGLIGGEVGEFMTDTVSDQLKFALDSFNVLGGFLFGQEYAEGIAKGGAALTGARVEDVRTVQSIATDVFSTALAATGFIPAAALYRAASDYSEATMYGTSRSAAFQDTMKGVLVDTATGSLATSFAAANAAAGGVTPFTKATQGVITGTASGALSGLVSGSDNILKAVGTGALMGGAGAAIGTVANSAFATVGEAFAGTGIGQTIGFSPSSRFAQALVNAGSGFVGDYATQTFRYAVDDEYREEINNQIESGLVSNKEAAFVRSSVAGAAAGVYNAFTQAAQEDFGTTLGELAARPTAPVDLFTAPPLTLKDEGRSYMERVPQKQGYFSELGLATPEKQEAPSFSEFFYGEDGKFEFGDVFGGEGKGIAEAFVEAAGLAVAGSFAMGLINPRTGPVGGYQFRKLPANAISNEGLGGPTYGGYIQQDYGGAGPSPAGSEAIANIAARVDREV